MTTNYLLYKWAKIWGVDINSHTLYVPCPFRIWATMAFYNILYFLVLSKFYVLIFLLIPVQPTICTSLIGRLFIAFFCPSYLLYVLSNVNFFKCYFLIIYPRNYIFLVLSVIFYSISPKCSVHCILSILL